MSACSSLLRAWFRSRCACSTKKLVVMPAWNFFSSASRRFSASARDARVASTRLLLVVTVRATSRTSVATRMREASSCLAVCWFCSRARARLASCVEVPSG